MKAYRKGRDFEFLECIVCKKIHGNAKYCSHKCYWVDMSNRVGNNHSHKMTKTRIYRTWRHMIERCSNPNASAYKNYGARGIKVCEQWKKFENFYEDMKSGYNDNLTIERVDVNGHYEPSNCTWVTWKEQHLNKTTNRKIKYKGLVKTIGEWAKYLGIKRTTLRMRLDVYGYSVEKAFTEKVAYNHES